jgi:hypothetical protein
MRDEIPIYIRLGFIIVLAIIAFIFVSTQVSKLFDNPCWKELKTGLEPLQMKNVYRQPLLTLSEQCLKKVVITSDEFTCANTCNQDKDDKAAAACADDCRSAEDPVTYIVLMPKEKGWLGNFWSGASRLSLNWMSEGKPYVIKIYCDVNDVVGIDECEETYGMWVCRPEGVTQYPLNVEMSAEGKTCVINAAGAASSSDEFPGPGGGEFGGGGAGGEH